MLYEERNGKEAELWGDGAIIFLSAGICAADFYGRRKYVSVGRAVCLSGRRLTGFAELCDSGAVCECREAYWRLEYCFGKETAVWRSEAGHMGRGQSCCGYV